MQILLWIFFMPILILCGIIGGIFLIIAGAKYRKLLVIISGIVCCSFIIMPFVFLGMGIDMEKLIPIPTVMYWSLFALTGLFTCLSGSSNQIVSIRNVGIIICSAGTLGAIFYQII
ncbi:ammonia permease [Bacillus sp. NPDC077411]|uniref:Ammonia permease n=1 Tax=Bacillus bruguierae TaxID=3127667 RepID=A0ABU8FGP8_9BACI